MQLNQTFRRSNIILQARECLRLALITQEGPDEAAFLSWLSASSRRQHFPDLVISVLSG